MLQILVFVMPTGLHRMYGAHHLHFYELFLLTAIAFLSFGPSAGRFLFIPEHGAGY